MELFWRIWYNLVWIEDSFLQIMSFLWADAQWIRMNRSWSVKNKLQYFGHLPYWADLPYGTYLQLLSTDFSHIPTHFSLWVQISKWGFSWWSVQLVQAFVWIFLSFHSRWAEPCKSSGSNSTIWSKPWYGGKFSWNLSSKTLWVKRGRTASNGARTEGLNENPKMASRMTSAESRACSRSVVLFEGGSVEMAMLSYCFWRRWEASEIKAALRGTKAVYFVYIFRTRLGRC